MRLASGIAARLGSDPLQQELAHLIQVGLARPVGVARVELFLMDQPFGFDEAAGHVVGLLVAIHPAIIPR